MRKIRNAKVEFLVIMNKLSNLDNLEIRIEQKKQEVLIQILIDMSLNIVLMLLKSSLKQTFCRKHIITNNQEFDGDLKADL